MDLHTYLVIAALNSQVQSAQISQDTSNYSREPTYYAPQPTYSAPVPTYTPPTRFIGSPPSNANQWEDRQTRQIQERHRSYPNLDYSTHVTYGEKDVDHLVDLRSSQLSTSTRTRVAKTSASLLSAVPSQKFFAPRVVSTGTEGYYQRNLGLSKEDTQDEAYMMKIRKASGREPVHEIKKFVQKGVKKTVRDINRGNLREAGGAISRNLHEFGEHVAPHATDAATEFVVDEAAHVKALAGGPLHPFIATGVAGNQVRRGHIDVRSRLDKVREATVPQAKKAGKSRVPSIVNRVLGREKK